LNFNFLHKNLEVKMKKSYLALIIAIVFSLTVSSCTFTTGGSYSAQSFSQDKELTVGTLQKELRVGMSGAELIQALGSPNIITRDQNGFETWVYDRIATEARYNESANILFLMLYAQGSSSSNATVSQKTLTVVVKMNEHGRVDSFAYHSSKF